MVGCPTYLGCRDIPLFMFFGTIGIWKSKMVFPFKFQGMLNLKRVCNSEGGQRQA